MFYHSNWVSVDVKESDWQLFFWLVFSFTAGLSLYGLSIHGILKRVTLDTSFLPAIFPQIYNQVATIYTFTSDFSVELLFRKRH